MLYLDLKVGVHLLYIYKLNLYVLFQERVFLWQKQAVFRRHTVLLPKRGPSSAPRQRTPGRVLRGDQVLRAGRAGHQQIPVTFIPIIAIDSRYSRTIASITVANFLQRGRGFYQGGGEASALQRTPAQNLAAVRVPRELASRPRCCHHLRVRYPALHRHFLPGNAAWVQTLQGVQHHHQRH